MKHNGGMATVELPDQQWSKILRFLRSCPDLYVGAEADCRRFVEAVLWMARSGAQWRLRLRKSMAVTLPCSIGISYDLPVRLSVTVRVSAMLLPRLAVSEPCP